MTTPPVWQRYVAVGDSFSEGMSDPDPARAGRYAGWADRLATHLAGLAAAVGSPFDYANLAVRGRLLDDVVGPQLEAALAQRPDLVSIVGGGNDILRPSADVRGLAARLDDAVARIRATGADVLMATSTDVSDAGVFRAVAGRQAAYTAHIWAIARRHDAFVMDLFTFRAIQDWRMWAEDRLHLNSEGHHRTALLALRTLGYPTPDDAWQDALPPAAAIPRRQAAAAHLRWGSQHAAPWVGRRLRGESSGAAMPAKRPLLAPWPDGPHHGPGAG